MKKTFVLMFLIFSVIAAASCTVVVKERPSKWAIVNTFGENDVIKVWRMDGLAGESIAVLTPGTKVRILKVKAHSVLIELPGGNTGWISRKHFGADLEVY
jgi:hypothetical protein